MSKSIAFLYPNSGISPHRCHREWAESVGAEVLRTPMGHSFFQKPVDADIIITESLYSLPVAMKSRKKYGSKIISIIPDTSFCDDKMTFARKLYFRDVKHIDGFITVSHRIADDIKKYTGKTASVVRPYAVNIFDNNHNKMFFSNNHILFIGNSTRDKGYPILEQLSDITAHTYHFIGSCCDDIKGKECIKHGRVSIDEMNRIISECAFYCHPATFDPCPVTVFEAMHAGMLTVISDCIGQAEIFDGELGQLVCEPDIESVKSKLNDIYALPDDAKSMLVNLLKQTEAKYCRKNSITRFRDEFEKMVM